MSGTYVPIEGNEQFSQVVDLHAAILEREQEIRMAASADPSDLLPLTCPIIVGDHCDRQAQHIIEELCVIKEGYEIEAAIPDMVGIKIYGDPSHTSADNIKITSYRQLRSYPAILRPSIRDRWNLYFQQINFNTNGYKPNPGEICCLKWLPQAIDGKPTGNTCESSDFYVDAKGNIIRIPENTTHLPISDFTLSEDLFARLHKAAKLGTGQDRHRARAIATGMYYKLLETRLLGKAFKDLDRNSTNDSGRVEVFGHPAKTPISSELADGLYSAFQPKVVLTNPYENYRVQERIALISPRLISRDPDLQYYLALVSQNDQVTMELIEVGRLMGLQIKPEYLYQ